MARSKSAAGAAERAASPAVAGVGVPRALAVTVYGALSCEDTAITRSRLRALGIPFRDVDIDAEPDGLARVLELNGGRRVTPTLVVGRDDLVAAEPSIERLEELVARAGYRCASPRAVQFHGTLAGRPVPLRTLSTAQGTSFSLEQLRTRRQAALFFAHGAGCLACLGYAKQLASQQAPLVEVGAEPIVVLTDEPTNAQAWLDDLPAGTTVLCDPDGAWRRLVAAHVGAPQEDLLLLVLDRYGAPRAGSFAAEAGGLIAPGETTEWCRFVALDGSACADEVPWPE